MRAALTAIAVLAAAYVSGAHGRARHIAAVPMSWTVEQAVDSGTGVKTCLVVSAGRDVTARLSGNGGAGAAAWSVIVGYDNTPGSLRYLRVGKAIYTSARPLFRDSEAGEIVARLRLPGEFVFEWAQGSNQAKRGGLYGTGDFAAKAASCEAWVRGTRI